MVVTYVLIGVVAGILSGLFDVGGGGAGARLAHVIPAATLQRMFTVFMVIGAARLWLKAGGE